MQLRNCFMKITSLNVRKCHSMCLGKDTRNGTFIFKSLVMKNIKEHKILGVTIGNKLTFKIHINEQNSHKRTSKNIKYSSLL